MALQVPCLRERVVHGGEELLVIEWFDEEGYGPDLHGSGPSREVFARGDDDNARPRRETPFIQMSVTTTGTGWA